MPAVKHIEGLATELNKSIYYPDEVSVDVERELIFLNFDRNKAYNLTIPSEYNHNFTVELSGSNNKNYSGTWEVDPKNGFSCSFNSKDFVLMGTLNWGTDPPPIHYFYFVPTQNKMLCFITSD